MLSPSLDLAELWVCHVVPQTLPTLEEKAYHFIGIEFTAVQVAKYPLDLQLIC